MKVRNLVLALRGTNYFSFTDDTLKALSLDKEIYTLDEFMEVFRYTAVWDMDIFTMETKQLGKGARFSLSLIVEL